MNCWKAKFYKVKMKKFYVYEWIDLDNNYVFYVGKGCGKRYSSLRNRNKKFLNYVNNHNVESRIVKYFDSEDEAFKYEKELMDYYKSSGQCSCSLMDGGFGGFSKVWSKEMKEYWSENNPMKSEEQKLRMSVNNPMKNNETANKVSECNKRPIIINGTYYKGTVDASKILGVATNTILNWCKRGYDTEGNPCRYANEEQRAYKFKKTCSKPILLDKTLLFNSVRECANYLGKKDTSPLVHALKRGKPYNGHLVEYANQQPSQ